MPDKGYITYHKQGRSCLEHWPIKETMVKLVPKYDRELSIGAVCLVVVEWISLKGRN